MQAPGKSSCFQNSLFQLLLSLVIDVKADTRLFLSVKPVLNYNQLTFRGKESEREFNFPTEPKKILFERQRNLEHRKSTDFGKEERVFKETSSPD